MGGEESEIVECTVERDTGKAYLLRDKKTGKSDWFPSSQVFFEERNMKTGHAHADIPIWLLEKKGW